MYVIVILGTYVGIHLCKCTLGLHAVASWLLVTLTIYVSAYTHIHI